MEDSTQAMDDRALRRCRRDHEHHGEGASRGCRGGSVSAQHSIHISTSQGLAAVSLLILLGSCTQSLRHSLRKLNSTSHSAVFILSQRSCVHTHTFLLSWAAPRLDHSLCSRDKRFRRTWNTALKLPLTHLLLSLPLLFFFLSLFF